MKIIKIDTEEFNKLKFDRREITSKGESTDELMILALWAQAHNAVTVYKYKRPNGILWIVEAK